MEFERNKDPKKAVKLGKYRIRNFEDNKDLLEWITDNLLHILESDEYPISLSSKNSHKIKEYLEEYILLQNKKVPWVFMVTVENHLNLFLYNMNDVRFSNKLWNEIHE